MYTPSGPFNSGGPPGLDSPFFNNVENWIQQAEGDTGAIVLNGSIAGTVTLYQFMQGMIKAALLVANGYYNGGVQALNLPTPFVQQFWFVTTGINQISFYNGASLVTAQVQSSVSATGGGYTNETLVKGFVSGQCIQPVSQIQTGIASSANTGLVFMIGV